MKKVSFKKYFLCILCSIPLLICISYVQVKINTIKEEDKLTNTEIIKNAPPVVAFVTIVLGSFRGLLADILWLRAISLQDQGKYFEMVQLASWITKLQPKFTGSTVFLAWNMAFNISVTCSSFEDRWRWVRKGIELIRDEALIYNPADPLLYKELAWIYKFKIGNMLDDAHQYYKNRLALEMMSVLGKTQTDWEALATAPKSEEELYKIVKLDNNFWKDTALKENTSKTEYRNMKELEEDFRLFGDIPEKVKEALKNDQTIIKTLDNYLRAKWIREKYKLDPQMVLALNKKYGKLDWRLPEAHAIYWATMGIKNDVSGDININCNRIITQSIKDAFMGGKLLMVDPDSPNTYICMPNFDVADSVVEASREAIANQGPSGNTTFKSGMINFLKDIVVMMYTFGKYGKAEKYLKELQKEEPKNLKYRMGLDNFVMKEWKEDIRDASVKQAKAIIGSMIYQAYYLYACGEDETAAAHMKLADSLIKLYKSDNKYQSKRRRIDFDQLKEAQKKYVKEQLKALKKYSRIKDMIEKSPEELQKEEKEIEQKNKLSKEPNAA